MVPPLLLQPLVENAVTHGMAHVLAGGTIRVAVSRAASTLTIVVENPCDPDRPRRTGSGVGLANVRARLRALYGDGCADVVWRTGRRVARRDVAARSSCRRANDAGTRTVNMND